MNCYDYAQIQSFYRFSPPSFLVRLLVGLASVNAVDSNLVTLVVVLVCAVSINPCHYRVVVSEFARNLGKGPVQG